MRRLEHADGKFWAVETTETGLRIKWGPIGTYGQNREMPLPRAQAAAKIAELVAKQVALGYKELADAKTTSEELVATIFSGERWYRQFRMAERECAVAVEGRYVTYWREGEARRSDLRTFERARGEAREWIQHWLEAGMVLTDGVEPASAERDKPAKSVANPELVAQCRAAPDDPAPFSVYADWLLEQNDPIGELVAGRAAGGQGEPNLGLVGQVELTGWRHGFPTAAAIKVSEEDGMALDKLVEEVLAHPLCAFLVHFQLGLASFASDNNWTSTLRAITSSPNGPYTKTLAFDLWTSEEQELSWVNFGNFSKAWAKLPRLEELRIMAGNGGTLGAIDLPMLKKLVRISGGLQANEIKSIVAARWPSLESLEIAFGQANYGAEGTTELLRPLLAAKQVPQLRHLALTNCEFISSLLPQLFGSPLLRQLSTLSLAEGTMGAAEEALLVAHAAELRHLVKLDVSHNFMEAGDALQRALPNLVSRAQRHGQRYAMLGE